MMRIPVEQSTDRNLNQMSIIWIYLIYRSSLRVRNAGIYNKNKKLKSNKRDNKLYIYAKKRQKKGGKEKEKRGKKIKIKELIWAYDLFNN